MRLTTAQKMLMAAALTDRHELTVGQALAYADTAAAALAAENPTLTVVASMFEEQPA